VRILQIIRGLIMENKAVVISERIAIGISSCCMGCPVRYNAKGYDLLQGLGREKGDFKWCPVCPECMAGLGVPRDPIHISGGDGSIVWSGEAEVKNRRGVRVTEDVKDGAADCMRALKRAGAVAFVYMDGSPTCGVYRTTLKDQKRGNPPGVFGALLLENGFFLIPAADIQSPIKWWDWRRRLMAFYWLKNLQIENKDHLYSAWHKLKFLSQELDEPWAREMGRKLAAMGKETDREFIEAFRKELLDLLRKPSNLRRIKNSLWKNYSYYRKAKGKSVEAINSPEFKRNVTAVAKELLLMERTSFEDELLFGSSPVIYREKRRVKENPSEVEPAKK
jgi:uncharacterized protein YbbK (DUF523 family)